MWAAERWRVFVGWWRILMRLLRRGWRSPRDDHARLEELERLYADLLPGFSEVPSIMALDLLRSWDDPRLRIVDARGPEEQAVSMLPTAVPLATVDAASLRGSPVVVYCTVGMRSGLAARRLRLEGVEAVNLAGGVLAWTHVGGPLFRGLQPVRDVHVYGEPWDLARTDYEAMW